MQDKGTLGGQLLSICANIAIPFLGEVGAHDASMISITLKYVKGGNST